MLERLDEVAWGSLTHAYGEASDVPDILRAVAAGDGDALSELWGNIWHQGTVYAATAHAVPFLIELLDADHVDTAELLALLHAIAGGSSYHDAHRELLARSERESEETMVIIARELGWVSAAHDAVVAGVPRYLHHLAEGETERIRAAAAYTLGACTDAHARITPALKERIASDESALVRASAIFAAAKLGRASEEALSRWLEDPEPLPRLSAALAETSKAGELSARVVDVLAEDAPRCLGELERLEWSSAHASTFVIEHVRTRPELEISLLSRWMRHASVEVRKSAVFSAEQTMQAWRWAPERLVPELARCLSDPERDVRYWAASQLASCGRAALQAADALWELLEREPLARNQPSAYALKALCKLRDPRAATYVAAELEAIATPAKGRQGHGWRFAAQPSVTIPASLSPLLTLLGGWAAECFDPLVRLIPLAPAGNDRISVIIAVGAFGERAVAAVPALRAELDAHPQAASRVLGDIGPLAVDALADLRAMLRHDIAIIRVNAARAVWRIAEEAGAALPVLRESIGPSSDRYARSHALQVIGEMGSAAASLAPLLPPYFRVDDEWSSVRAAVAYWHLTGDAARAVPPLLEHIVPLPRGHEAVGCLADIGPAAGAAVPRLREELSSQQRASVLGLADELIDDDERWVELCQCALDRIGPG